MAKFYKVCFTICIVGSTLAYLVLISADGNPDGLMFGKMTALYSGMVGGWGLFDYDRNRPRR